MTTAETLAGSGAVLGGVAVLLAQQLGFLSLSELWPTVLWFLLSALAGGILLGLVGRHLDRR